jgi:hypothetical protein
MHAKSGAHLEPNPSHGAPRFRPTCTEHRITSAPNSYEVESQIGVKRRAGQIKSWSRCSGRSRICVESSMTAFERAAVQGIISRLRAKVSGRRGTLAAYTRNSCSVRMNLRCVRIELRSVRGKGLQRTLRVVQRARDGSSVWGERVLRRLESLQRTLRGLQRRLHGFICRLRGFISTLRAVAA